MRVFITGASSGLGRALAHAYAAQGATLGLVARRTEVLDELVRELPSPANLSSTSFSPSETLSSVRNEHKLYALDVTDREALHQAAYDFQQLGPTDIVIACAGISVGTLTEYPEDFAVFERVHRTNVLGLVATFEPFLSAMKAANHGTLVGIGSVAGVRGLPGAGAYSSSKAAVRVYCESLRAELHGSALKVVTIAPGFIDTPMTQANPYAMPFLMPVEKFTKQALKAIEQGKSYTVIPWQMGVVGKLLRLVPNKVYDHFVSRRGRKPRQS